MVINVISGGLEMSGISHTAAKKSTRNAKNGLEDPVSVELPLLRKNGTLSLEPKEILSMRYVQTDEEPVTKFLVSWNHLPIDEGKWKYHQQLTLSFPRFDATLRTRFFWTAGVLI